MTTHEEHDHQVANPDRIVLDDEGKADKAESIEKWVHDQEWPDVAEEVKEAVEHADGPLG